jgi:hypothetical protein
MNVISRLTVAALAGFLLSGCGPAGDDRTGAIDGPAGDAPEPAEAQTSAAKPGAPVDFDYAIIGTPVVGQPVSINLRVSSRLRDRPVTLNYRIDDARNLKFPEAQAQRVALPAFRDTERVTEQITVVPQQEGRLYLNVYAEVETGGATLMKSMAIPIQVGRAPRQPETNGEPRKDADGETVMSLPAEETTR